MKLPTEVIHQAGNIPKGANAILGAIKVKEVCVTATKLDHVADSAIQLTVGIHVIGEIAQLELIAKDAIPLCNGQRFDRLRAESLLDAERGK